jgi:hypothetical protein
MPTDENPDPALEADVNAKLELLLKEAAIIAVVFRDRARFLKLAGEAFDETERVWAGVPPEIKERMARYEDPGDE